MPLATNDVWTKFLFRKTLKSFFDIATLSFVVATLLETVDVWTKFLFRKTLKFFEIILVILPSYLLLLKCL